MRKILFLGTALLFVTATFATANVEAPILKADQLFFPVGKNGQKISYAQLATISLADLQALTGKKMGFIQRLNFRMAQSRMKKSIQADGTIKNKGIQKFFAKKGGAGDSGFHLGGFALGFLLGLIGVLIAYLLNDDYKQNRVKWAWIGCAVFAVLWIILVVAVFATASSLTP
jgi:hypothetical protein